jgi:hypothetical protein
MSQGLGLLPPRRVASHSLGEFPLDVVRFSLLPRLTPKAEAEGWSASTASVGQAS